MQRQTHEFLDDKLEPYIRPDLARTSACAMAPNLTIVKGDRLAQITAVGNTKGRWTKADVTKITAPVAGPTLAASGADGTLPTGVYALCYTYVNANGETTISPVVTVTVGNTNHITVSAITPLPTGVVSANLYITDAGGHDFHLAQAAWDGTALNVLAPANSIVEPPTKNTAYLKTDGSQRPEKLAVRSFVTDADGNVFEGTEPYTTGPFASPNDTAMAYDLGYFLKSKLPSITDDEIALMGATVHGVNDNVYIHLS